MMTFRNKNSFLKTSVSLVLISALLNTPLVAKVGSVSDSTTDPFLRPIRESRTIRQDALAPNGAKPLANLDSKMPSGLSDMDTFLDDPDALPENMMGPNPGFFPGDNVGTDDGINPNVNVNNPPENSPPPGVVPSPAMKAPAGTKPVKRSPPTMMPPGNQPPKRMPPSSLPQARPNNRPGPQEEIFRVVPQSCKKATGVFTWNFQEESLMKVLQQMADFMCSNIGIFDPKAIENTPITIIGTTPLTVSQAFDITQASLASKGFALVKQGASYSLVKRGDVRQHATPFYSEALQAPNNEAIGTLFYKSKHTTPEALRNIAKLLISPAGVAEPVAEQFLLVIDTNSNIKRLGHIIEQIDLVDAMNKVYVIPLVHAEAKVVEKQLRDLYDINPTRNPRSMMRMPTAGLDSKIPLDIDKILADDRTNSLILVANKDSKDEIDSIIKLIDVPATAGNKGKIYVYNLKYGEAKKIADTLNNVVKQGGNRPRFGPRRPDEKSNEIFEGEVKVTAHEDTNSLVTVASATDYQSLLLTIAQLDVKKVQVYVEAVIMDLQVTGNNKMGINLFGGVPGDLLGLNGSLGMLANPGGRGMAEGISTTLTQSGGAGLDVGGLGKQSIGAIAVLGNFLQGGVAGIVGPPIGNSSIPSFGAVLQALSTSTQIDILSTPTLLTSDNVEATMAVGEKIPVIKGISSVGGGMGSLGMPMQNVTYEPVQLSFKITPSVGEKDIRIKVVQEVNELGRNMPLANGTTQSAINTKSTDTTVVAANGQTVVLGGLSNDRTTKADNKIPWLGDIPILGWLFKTRQTDTEKRMLFLVMTPYVIKSERDYKEILDKKTREREEFNQLYYGGKITDYKPFVRYDLKTGPLSSLVKELDNDMKRPENGGTVNGKEKVLKPKAERENAQSLETPMATEADFMLETDTYVNNNSDPMSTINEEPMEFGEGYKPLSVPESRSSAKNVEETVIEPKGGEKTPLSAH